MESFSIVHEHNFTKPCDYKILIAGRLFYTDAVKDLEESVKDYINKGWIPQGGISISKDRGSYVLSQVMIKVSKE